MIHLVEGEQGCREAVDRQAIAVVVDALRTSVTLPWIFELGAAEVYAAIGINEVHALRTRFPDALLAGEQGGHRIPGFDLGNSPAELREQPPRALAGRVVLFASSAGSRRLVEVAEAPEVYVGSPANARRVALHVGRRARETGREVCVIAAGHPDRDVATPEDQWAAAYLASLIDIDVAAEGRPLYDRAVEEVLASGLAKLYRQSPNARRLVKLGQERDVEVCAERNVCRSVPMGSGLVELNGSGAGALRLVRADLDDLWLTSRA